MHELLTPTDVSRILGVPEKTLAHWRTQRTGPMFLRVGVNVRYRPDDLEAWIQQRLDEARAWMAS